MYQDPEGTRSLEGANHTDGTNNKKHSMVSTTDDEYYRNRIQELNQEIIALNKKNKVLNNENKVLNDENKFLNDKVAKVGMQ